MASTEGAVISIADHKRRFEQVLAKALRSKGNLLILARCANQLNLRVVEQKAQELVAPHDVVTDIERGRVLWDLLRKSIDRLRPENSEPELIPGWRLYAIAEGVYIRGKSAKAMVAELDISSRTFYRERRAAVEALATIVWQIEDGLTAGEGDWQQAKPT